MSGHAKSALVLPVVFIPIAAFWMIQNVGDGDALGSAAWGAMLGFHLALFLVRLAEM